MPSLRLILAALAIGVGGWLVWRGLYPSPKFCPCCYRPVNIVSKVIGPGRVQAGVDPVRLLGVEVGSLSLEQQGVLGRAIEDWIREYDEVVILINKEDLPGQVEADGALPAWLMDSKSKAIFNVELAARGLVPVREEPYTHLLFLEEMRQAAAKAREAGLGIWYTSSPEPN